MRSSRSRGDIDLAVIISLAIAVGMLIGAVAAIWLWGAMSEGVGVIMSFHANELSNQSSGHGVILETIEGLRQGGH